MDYLNETEKDFVKRIKAIFENHFNLFDEITSVCNKKRIDLVLQHKKYNHVFFGIECKRFDRKTGNEIGKIVKQASDYASRQFKVCSKIISMPILLCPSLSVNYFVLPTEKILYKNKLYYKDRHDPTDKHHTMNGFLGAFGVGEVRSLNDNYYFSFNNFILFESNPTQHLTRTHHGIHFANYNKFFNL